MKTYILLFTFIIMMSCNDRKENNSSSVVNEENKIIKKAPIPYEVSLKYPKDSIFKCYGGINYGITKQVFDSLLSNENVYDMFVNLEYGSFVKYKANGLFDEFGLLEGIEFNTIPINSFGGCLLDKKIFHNSDSVLIDKAHFIKDGKLLPGADNWINVKPKESSLNLPQPYLHLDYHSNEYFNEVIKTYSKKYGKPRMIYDDDYLNKFEESESVMSCFELYFKERKERFNQLKENDNEINQKYYDESYRFIFNRVLDYFQDFEIKLKPENIFRFSNQNQNIDIFIFKRHLSDNRLYLDRFWSNGGIKIIYKYIPPVKYIKLQNDRKIEQEKQNQIKMKIEEKDKDLNAKKVQEKI